METALVTYVVAGLVVGAYIVRVAAVNRRLFIRGQRLQELNAEHSAQAPVRQSA
jgi:hypothetical protein